MRRLHPLGRMGTPAEVARVTAALMSDDFVFVSGAVIPIDGDEPRKLLIRKRSADAVSLRHPST
jgi:hypothetical protein